MPQIALADTSDIDANRIFVDLSEEIAELEGQEGVLSLLTRRASDEMTEKPTYEHYETDLRALTVATGSTATNSATTLTLATDDNDNIHVDMILYVPRTDERMRVTAVDRGAETIDVVRGVGSSSGAALNNGETLLIIGNAHMEGVGAPEEINADVTKVTNYTQIFRHSFSVTGTLASTVLEAGDPEFDRLSSQKSREHVREIELANLFGVANEDLSGSQPRRTTGGLYEHISTNVSDQSSSALTEQELDDFAADVFQYGSDTKWLLAGSNVMKSINKFARDDLRTRVAEDTFGLRIQEYITSFGRLNVTHHKLMSRHGNADKAFIVDLEGIQRRPLSGNGRNRDNVLRMNIQTPDEDVLKSEYLTEVGFEVFNEQKHGVIINAAAP